MLASYQIKAVEGNPPVKKPRSRIIGGEPDCHIVVRVTGVDDISSHRILIVIHRTICASDDIEGMLVRINS